MDAPFILEGDDESVFVGWNKTEGAIFYTLQMSTGDDDNWETVSSSARTNALQEKLKQNLSYRFRVKYKSSALGPDAWSNFSEASELYSPSKDKSKHMAPPALKEKDESSITVTWDNVEGASGYMLRYREDAENTWIEASAPISADHVRKNGLKNDGTSYVFSVKPVVEGAKWNYSRQSFPLKATHMSKVCVHATGNGCTTMHGRADWFEFHGVTDPKTIEDIGTSLFANPDLDAPIYFWQLYSILGTKPLEAILENFYGRIFDDEEQHMFKQAFVDNGEIDHHVRTQVYYWIDAFGGGEFYYGSEGRINFHHLCHAEQVMDAKGATRWMFHMKRALQDNTPALEAIDPRALPCIYDFIRTKMMKYAIFHKWDYDDSDFDGVPLPSYTQRLPVSGCTKPESQPFWKKIFCGGHT